MILLLSALFGADDGQSRIESVNRFLHGISEYKDARTGVALRDSDGDGKPEALVYLTGSDWCGSGGCTLLILAPKGSSRKIVAEISITRPRIRMMATKTNDWNDLGVWVVGGRNSAGLRKRTELRRQDLPGQSHGISGPASTGRSSGRGGVSASITAKLPGRL